MSLIELNAIAAMCNENRGIGLNNDLPWKLPNEFKYFLNVIKTTTDKTKVNALITGRLNWLSMRQKPLESFNIYFIISSKTSFDLFKHLNKNELKRCIICKSIDEALEIIQNQYKDVIENVFAIGGVEIYRSSIQSPHFKRFYLTRILENYECDVFLQPENFLDNFKKLKNQDLINESVLFDCEYNVIQTEPHLNVKYIFEAYEKIKN